jgi:hypothetical protein
VYHLGGDVEVLACACGMPGSLVPHAKAELTARDEGTAELAGERLTVETRGLARNSRRCP